MFGPTAEQQLLPAVRERQVLDGREAACHGSAQVTRVAERPHRQAVQVHRLHQVRQERPLEAHNAPPVGTQTGYKSEQSLTAFTARRFSLRAR